MRTYYEIWDVWIYKQNLEAVHILNNFRISQLISLTFTNRKDLYICKSDSTRPCRSVFRSLNRSVVLFSKLQTIRNKNSKTYRQFSSPQNHKCIELRTHSTQQQQSTTDDASAQQQFAEENIPKIVRIRNLQRTRAHKSEFSHTHTQKTIVGMIGKGARGTGRERSERKHEANKLYFGQQQNSQY